MTVAEDAPVYRRTRSGGDRQWVGPDGAREDVTDLSDRELLLRAYNEVLCLRFDFGGMMREVGEVKSRLDRDENEITLVRELRSDVRVARRWLTGIVAGVVVIVVAAYVCMKLGLVPVGR